MNWKRLGMAIAAVFVFIMATDFLVHGNLLTDTYMATAPLWREKAEMQNYMGWMMLGQALASAMLVFIFAKGYENKGWMEGVRFGWYAFLLMISHTLIQYATTPVPAVLLWAWIGLMFVQAIGAGTISSLIYRRSAA